MNHKLERQPGGTPARCAFSIEFAYSALRSWRFSTPC